jgi:hypothetical protein
LTEAQKETEQQLRETDEFLKQRFRETDEQLKRQLQETKRLMRRQNHPFNKQLGKLGNRLGEFVEWQVRPVAVG